MFFDQPTEKSELKPRTLCVDLKGSEALHVLRAPRKALSLETLPSETEIPNWGGKTVTIVKEAPVEMEKDFFPPLPYPFPPSSCYQLRERADAFTNFSEGHDIPKDQWDSIIDSSRRLLESCDHLQGALFFVDADSGFGGMGSDFLDEWKDESRVPVVTMAWAPQIPSRHPRDTFKVPQVINNALSLFKLSERSALYFPLQNPSSSSFPQLSNYNETNSFHSSAIIAAASTTAFLPCRLRQRSVHLSDLLSPPVKVPVGTLRVSLPVPWDPSSLGGVKELPGEPLGAGGNLQVSPWTANVVLRGFSSKLSNEFSQKVPQLLNSPVTTTIVDCHLPTKSPFPPLVETNELSVLTQMNVSREATDFLEESIDLFRRVNQHSASPLYCSDFETYDEYLDISNSLETIADSYKPED